MSPPAGPSTTDIAWERGVEPPAPPLVEPVAYLELTLEHPGLSATGVCGDFFPVAVPYRLGDEHRVFFWRPYLADGADRRRAWEGACATTHALHPVLDDEPTVPQLWRRTERTTEVVVDGTVAGDSLTATLRDYRAPKVTVERLDEDAVALDVDGEAVVVPSGTRTAVGLATRRVTPVGDDAPTAVEPRLVVRYPGRRMVYHPAPGEGYACFPDFGLEFEALPNPVAVPTRDDELDDDALATALGVDLDARPYPERVLWQAFAHWAFDPHGGTTPRLVPVEPGLVVLVDQPG